MEFEEMSQKDIVLQNIMLLNHVELIDFLTSCERTKKDYDKLGRKLPPQIYEQYKHASEQYEYLKTDDEVIEALAQRISEIEYNEESKTKQAMAVYAISALLSLDISKQAGDENNWREIQDRIAGVLEEMSSKDLVTTFEMSGRQGVLDVETYNEVYTDRIADMDEMSFLRFITDLRDLQECKSEEMKEQILKRLTTIEPLLAQRYLLLCKENPEEILTILQVIEETDIDLEDVFRQIVDNSDERVKRKAIEVARKMSAKQKIRNLMLPCQKQIWRDNELVNILAEGIKQASDSELKLLFELYGEIQDCEIKNRIIEIATLRGMDLIEEKKNRTPSEQQKQSMKSAETIFLNANRITVIATIRTYRTTGRIIRSRGVGAGNEIYSKDIESLEEEVMNKYQLENDALNVSEELVKYLVTLEKSSDRQLIRNAIAEINRIPVQSSEENGLAGLRKGAYEDTIRYLSSRIWRMENLDDIRYLGLVGLQNPTGVLSKDIKDKIGNNPFDVGENPGSTGEER